MMRKASGSAGAKRFSKPRIWLFDRLPCDQSSLRRIRRAVFSPTTAACSPNHDGSSSGEMCSRQRA